MSASTSGSASGSVSMQNSVNSKDELNKFEVDKPLWNHVTKLERLKKRGGNFKFQCNYCNICYQGSYTRVTSHLLQQTNKGIKRCLKVTPEITAVLLKEVEAAKTRKDAQKPANVPLPPSSISGCSSNLSNRAEEFKKRKMEEALGLGKVGMNLGGSKLNPTQQKYNMQEREHLTLLIARMFYSAGLPFNFARNQFWVEVIQYAANHNLEGYIPPGYNMLRTSLLTRERANIEGLLDTIRGTWKEKGVTIVSDGWSDPQRRPLINFVAINEHGPMFIKAVNTMGEVKDKHFIAQMLKDVIVEVGARNVVQVITDNAPNCKAAGQLIEAQFPHIVWTPCVVHTLNLALKNICAAKNTENNVEVYDACHWISEIADDALVIKNYILNHSMRLAMYNEVVPLKLLSVAETRFASTIVMLKRFKLIKNALLRLVLSDKWDTYRAEKDGSQAAFLKSKVVNDDWWDQIAYILEFTGPIYDMIRFCDTDKPCLHLVYDMWDSMIEKVREVIYKHEHKRKDEESVFFDVVHTILEGRWNKSNTPLHCLAHSLNPRYYSSKWLMADSSRVAPHFDVEVTRERNKCFNRYFDDPSERSKVRVEYAHFSGCQGEFSDLECMREMGEMDPKDWWLVYGANAPMLQRLALKVLGQPSSSSCSERNWSTYAFIHSAKRNRMAPQRAEDLVFVHSNIRLLARQTTKYKEGETKLWDIAGDAFEDLDEVGSLGVANLTLDEPEMEAKLCNDGEEGAYEDLEDYDEDEDDMDEA